MTQFPAYNRAPGSDDPGLPTLGYWTPPASRPPRPRVWTPFVVFLTAVVAVVIVQAAAVILMVIGAGRGARPSEHDLMQLLLRPGVFLTLGALTPLTMGATVIWAAWLSRVPMRERLRLGPARAEWWIYIPIGLATLALSFALSTLHSLLNLPTGESLPMIFEMAAKLRGPMLVAGVVVIGLLPGVFEELLCRGYLQTRFRQRWGIAVSIIIASLLFGVMHLDPVQGALAAFLGAWLGYVTERTGSIRPAIFAHILNNSTMVLLIGLTSAAPEQEPPRDTQWVLLGVAVVVLGICALWFAAAMRGRPWPEPAPIPPPLPRYRWYGPMHGPEVHGGFGPPGPPPSPPSGGEAPGSSA